MHKHYISFHFVIFPGLFIFLLFPVCISASLWLTASNCVSLPALSRSLSLLLGLSLLHFYLPVLLASVSRSQNQVKRAAKLSTARIRQGGGTVSRGGGQLKLGFEMQLKGDEGGCGFGIVGVSSSSYHSTDMAKYMERILTAPDAMANTLAHTHTHT